MKHHFMAILLAALCGAFWQLADQSAAQENHLLAILMRMISFVIGVACLAFLMLSLYDDLIP